MEEILLEEEDMSWRRWDRSRRRAWNEGDGIGGGRGHEMEEMTLEEENNVGWRK